MSYGPTSIRGRPPPMPALKHTPPTFDSIFLLPVTRMPGFEPLCQSLFATITESPFCAAGIFTHIAMANSAPFSNASFSEPFRHTLPVLFVASSRCRQPPRKPPFPTIDALPHASAVTLPPAAFAKAAGALPSNGRYTARPSLRPRFTSVTTSVPTAFPSRSKPLQSIPKCVSTVGAA